MVIFCTSMLGAIMKQIYRVLCIIAISIFVVQAEVKTVKHSIKSGETLYDIAHQNHTTIQEVQKANHLKKGETLKVGRVLIVPQDTYFPKKKISKQRKQKFVKHTIKSGETLYDVAHRNHTTIEEVQQLNHLKKDEVLKIGRVLVVPKDTYFPEKKPSTHKKQKFVKHTIKSGETLYDVAHQNHTTIEEVQQLNHLKKDEVLKIGRVLKVLQNTYFATKKNLLKDKSLLLVKKTKNLKLTHKKKKIKVATLSKKKRVKKSLKKHKPKNTSHSFFDSILTWHSKGKTKSSKIASFAKKNLGKRYVWGATGRRGTFDCSGFTSYVYKKNGINIPRTSRNQAKYGKYVSRDKLQKGDLIFFDTSKRRRGYVNHVGIYLGNGKFIHASSAKRKVVVSRLSKFYAQRYKGARRPS